MCKGWSKCKLGSIFFYFCMFFHFHNFFPNSAFFSNFTRWKMLAKMNLISENVYFIKISKSWVSAIFASRFKGKRNRYLWATWIINPKVFLEISKRTLMIVFIDSVDRFKKKSHCKDMPLALLALIPNDMLIALLAKNVTCLHFLALDNCTESFWNLHFLGKKMLIMLLTLLAKVALPNCAKSAI